jgi:hypothetical protein
VRDIVDYADPSASSPASDGADWNLEIGVLAEIFRAFQSGRSPAVLFDQIKGYPPGMRIVSDCTTAGGSPTSFGFEETRRPTLLVRPIATG